MIMRRPGNETQRPHLLHPTWNRKHETTTGGPRLLVHHSTRLRSNTACTDPEESFLAQFGGDVDGYVLADHDLFFGGRLDTNLREGMSQQKGMAKRSVA